jgi:hypothetical protein
MPAIEKLQSAQAESGYDERCASRPHRRRMKPLRYVVMLGREGMPLQLSLRPRIE